jgi:hypothetical protein
MLKLKIYKVRMVDILGQEVAEFGFYESRIDAARRLYEVKKMVTKPGALEIREIDVLRDSKEIAAEAGITEEELKNFYDFKEES